MLPSGRHPVPTRVPLLQYLLYFLVTCLLETPFYVLAGRLIGRSWRKLAGQILLINTLTHPAVFFLFPSVFAHFHLNVLSMLTFAETFAILVEGFALVKLFAYPVTLASVASILANLFSWWVGILLLG